ncbi:GTPase activating protein (GAP) for Rho1p [Microbotryomycetes sp. JL201]|nr:GTPase activating protein (GAP) for Rho1p [Microbotryomycetes sp. JL201]
MATNNSAAVVVTRANLRASFDSSDPAVRAEAVKFRAEQERLERERERRLHERNATKRSLVRWWRAFTRKHGWSRHSASSLPSLPATKPAVSHAAGHASTSAPPASSSPSPDFRVAGRGLQRGQSGKDKVFGVSPQQSLKYASVAIRLVASDGKPYVYGYVPIVVAKCGMWLKENATHTQGIFRVSGSNKRINQLQTLFDTPPTYGRDLDWTGFSVHDAASVLRRYLNQMPEPVIPGELYLDFTAVLQRNLPERQAVEEYKKLIGLLPAPSRYLLLYLLDFLAVFVRCAQHNLMTASNLATVFQPGLVSTRREGSGGEGGALLGFPGFGADGEIVDSRRGSQPAWVQQTTTTKVNGKSSAAAGRQAREGAGEHGKGKEVLEFLIEQQSHFMLGLQPPIRDAQEGKSTKRKNVDGPLTRKRDDDEAHPGHKDAAEDSGYGQSSPSDSGGLTQMVSRTTTEGSVPSLLNALPPATRLASMPPDQVVASTSKTGSGPLAAELATSGTSLLRKGSEKSVERRRLRKNQEEAKTGSNGNGVRRSKTVPSRGSSRSSTPALPTMEGGSPNPNAPVTLKPARSRRKQHHAKSELPTVPASPDKSTQRASTKRDDSTNTMHTARTTASTSDSPAATAVNLLERSTSTKSKSGRSKVKADSLTGESSAPDTPALSAGPVQTATQGAPVLQPNQPSTTE